MAHPHIFVSYSHADSKAKERLLKHLEVLSDAAEFDVWTDSQIAAGEEWEPAIKRALRDANIAILLITADFLTSSFIRHKEVPTILQRRESKGLRIYPILAKPCAWQAVPWIKATQLRPVAAKPVFRSGGRYADDELARIALELLAIIQLVMKVQEAADDKARQQAEQERREKEKEITDLITRSPAIEELYSLKTVYSGFNENYPVYGLERDQAVADRQRIGIKRWRALRDLYFSIRWVINDVAVRENKIASKILGTFYESLPS
jgi:hypothetical protein